MDILSEVVKKNNPSNFIKYRTVREITQEDYVSVSYSNTQTSGAAAQKNVNTAVQNRIGNAPQNEINPVLKTYFPNNANVKPVNVPVNAQVPQKNKRTGAVFGVVIGIAVLLFVVIFAVLSLTDKTEAEKFESAVRHQKLTYEMCCDTDGKFYNYIRSDEGQDAICRFLNDYHSKDDLMSAVWLSAVLPQDYQIYLPEDYLFWFYTDTILLGKELESSQDTERVFSVGDYTVICTLDSDNQIDHIDVTDNNRTVQAQQYN